jgi:hypothetical protein
MRRPGLASLALVDWASIASFATALGTLVLAVATFAAVRSANRAARAAEQSLLVALRPLFLPSRLQDDPQKVMFGGGKWLRVDGGCGAATAEDGVVYLLASLRNVGSGIGVVHGWRFYPEPQPRPAPEVAEFRRQARDLYLPPGETGFWQGAFRDPSDPQYEQAWQAVESGGQMTVDILYGDHEGGQRVITRFGLQPRDSGGWLLSAARHWNVDRAEPR